MIATEWRGDRECSSELHSKVPSSRPASGPEPAELDVGIENYLLKVILQILLKCSVFITA